MPARQPGVLSAANLITIGVTMLIVMLCVVLHYETLRLHGH